MTFCRTCGRPRNTDSRFCGGCGNAFGTSETAAVPAADPADPATPEPAGPTRLDAPAGPTRLDAPAGPTRLDAPAGATRLDSALDAAPPGPHDSWYAEPSSAAGDAAPPDVAAGPPAAGRRLAGDTVTAGPAGPDAGQWLAGDTVTAGPAGPGGYAPRTALQPPAPPAPGYPQPPAPYGPQRQPGNRRTAAFVIAVVLVALAAGGGAYALAGGHRHTGAQAPGQPSVTASPGTTPPATAAPYSPVVNASASPTSSPSVPVTPSPAPTGTVRVAAGVAGDTAAPRVAAYLNRYFSAINSRDYNAYQSLLDAQEQAGNSRSTFDSGYATTKDSAEVLTGIQETGGGTLTAHVSFTSRQNPGDSVDGSACNSWQISLYLVPRGTSYVMTAAPPGYHAGYTDC